MSTPYSTIYDAFLAKVNDDEWSNPDELEYYKEDWKSILHAAIAMFKFPRFNLNYDDENEVMQDNLTTQEIEILGNLMKQEWLDRNIHTWDQIKTMYDERDFSQANMLRQLINTYEAVVKQNYHLQKNYSRSILNTAGYKQPFDYKVFGGG